MHLLAHLSFFTFFSLFCLQPLASTISIFQLYIESLIPFALFSLLYFVLHCHPASTLLVTILSDIPLKDPLHSTIFIFVIMSSNVPSYPIMEDWPFSRGGSSDNMIISEPPSSNPAFELYAEQGARFDDEGCHVLEDEPPLSEWEYLEEEEDVDQAWRQCAVEVDVFGEVDPLTEDECQELFGCVPMELSHMWSEESSSEGPTDEEGRHDQAEEIFRPNQPSTLRDDVLQRSLEGAWEGPSFFCCVCCQLLYPKEVHPLEYQEPFDWQHFDWPCLHYGHEPTLKHGYPSACQKHRKMNEDSLELVSFFCFLLFIFLDV